MTVLDVLKTASLYLDEESEFEPFFLGDTSSVSNEIQSKFEKLVEAFNVTIQSVFSKHFYKIASCDITVLNNTFDLNSLQNKCVKVLSLTKLGKKVMFEAKGDTLFVKQNGTFSLTFAYLPDNFAYTDSFNLLPMVDIGTLSLGVAGEYCYMQGIFDDAQMYLDRFDEALSKIKARQLSNKLTPQKRWI